jgi:hypothetical protein
VERRAETNRAAQSTRGAKKFLHSAKFFAENVLHNSDKFVQLPTSDIGFRALPLQSIIATR